MYNKIYDKKSSYKIHQAVIRGDIKEVKLIFKEDLSNINLIDKEGYDALQIASHNGNIEIVKLILETINQNNLDKESILGRKNNWDKNPLFIAANRGCDEHIKIVKLLLNEMSNELIENSSDRECSIIHLVTKLDDIEIIETILERMDQSFIVQADVESHTALFYSKHNENQGIVTKLLNKYQNPNELFTDYYDIFPIAPNLETKELLDEVKECIGSDALNPFVPSEL